MSEDRLLNDHFLKTVRDSGVFTSSQLKLIYNAADFAYAAHYGQFRKSGKPYLIHPIEIALKLLYKYRDFDLVVAALLHDAVEDNEDIDISEIYLKFGDKIGFMVDSVTKTTNSYYIDDELVFEDKVSKFLYGGLTDIKCIILKLADRENNLMTLDRLNSEKQMRMAFETQAIFEPLKSIIDYDNSNSVEYCYEKFQEYLKFNNIQDYSSLKNLLYNSAYSDFDNDTFEIVYENSGNIIRRLDDREMFDRMISTKNLESKIEILSVSMDENGEFSCVFKYIGGQVFEGSNYKFSIQDSYLEVK